MAIEKGAGASQGKRKINSSESSKKKKKKTEDEIREEQEDNDEIMPDPIPFLWEMFPDIDAEILRNKAKLITTRDELQCLVDTLVSTAKDDPEFFSESQQELTLPIDSRFLLYFKSYPFADPECLMDARANIQNNENNHLSQNVRTRARWLKNHYVEKLYTGKSSLVSGFNVEAFLDVFPDPLTFFNDCTRNVTNAYKQQVVSYLQDKYYKISNTDISRILTENNYQLLQTTIVLEKKRKNSKKKISDSEWQIPESVDPLLFYEVAYIENESKITDYISQLKTKREETVTLARSENQLNECSCCFEEELLNDEIFACNNEHKVCKFCIAKRAKVEFQKGHMFVPCFNPYCNEEFNLATLRKILNQKDFTRLVRYRQFKQITTAGVSGLELIECPFCKYSIILPSNGLPTHRCPYPFCLLNSCKQCKRLDHSPHPCDLQNAYPMYAYI